MKLLKSISLAVLLTPFSLQAATIDAWLVPQNSGPFEINDVFNVEIHASWDEQLMSGGFDLFFDPTIINFVSSTINVSSFPADTGTLQAAKIDNIGFSQGLMGGYAPTLDTTIATITFQAVGGGISSLILLDSGDDELGGVDPAYPWFAMLNGVDFEYHDPVFDTSNSDVTVNPVPLPAAAWFMLSGMGFLAFRRKRTV